MKTTPCFNLLMLNLFIGLVRGHRFLHPWSDQIKALGYQLFQVEPSFHATAGRTNPEAIACSKKRGHCLLAEWTQMLAPTQKKEQQLVRYQKVSRRDLVDNAGVPAASADQNSTWLVVLPNAASAFHPAIRTNGGVRLMISCFHIDNGMGYQLTYSAGEIQDNELAQVIKQTITAARIPTGYVRVTMENLSMEEYAETVAQQVTSFVVKNRWEFTAPTPVLRCTF